MPKGTIIGLRNMMYALLSNDPVTGVATYEAPVAVPGSISAKINPNATVESLFADDGPYDAAATLGKMTIDLVMADLDLDTQAAFLGHTVVGGVLKRLSTNVPPWLAIGFKSLKSNGKYRYTWLAKVKFMIPQQDNETKGDTVKFGTPSISGMFVKRDCDDEWERHIDEDHVDFVASMATNWFNDPYGGNSDVTPPTVTVVPADAATAVADNSTIVWTFNEPLMFSTIVKGNFLVFADASGAMVPGALSVNAAKEIVTFTPASNFTAATVYRAVVSTDVKDASGNAFAGSVTKFTTA